MDDHREENLDTTMRCLLAPWQSSKPARGQRD